jgi:hypothetical protein
MCTTETTIQEGEKDSDNDNSWAFRSGDNVNGLTWIGPPFALNNSVRAKYASLPFEHIDEADKLPRAAPTQYA